MSTSPEKPQHLQAGWSKRRIEFEPLQTGLDYLTSVVSHLRERSSPRDLKYAILHLAAAIEVLLKYRLAAEHWTLIFTKIDVATPEAYRSGDFQSVSPRGAINRLRKVVGVNISEESARRIKAVVDRRNKLQHHGLVDSAEAVRSVAADALDFLVTFVDDELRPMDEAGASLGVQPTLNKIREDLLAIRHFVRTRLQSLTVSLDALDVVVHCPARSQLAFVPGEPCKCRFCLAESEPEVAAEEYVEEILGQSRYLAIKDGEEWDLNSCPSCERDALVASVQVRRLGGLANDLPMWCCFVEGIVWERDAISPCDRCGEPTFDDHEGANMFELLVLDYIRMI